MNTIEDANFKCTLDGESIKVIDDKSVERRSRAVIGWAYCSTFLKVPRKSRMWRGFRSFADGKMMGVTKTETAIQIAGVLKEFAKAGVLIAIAAGAAVSWTAFFALGAISLVLAVGAFTVKQYNQSEIEKKLKSAGDEGEAGEVKDLLKDFRVSRYVANQTCKRFRAIRRLKVEFLGKKKADYRPGMTRKYKHKYWEAEKEAFDGIFENRGGDGRGDEWRNWDSKELKLTDDSSRIGPANRRHRLLWHAIKRNVWNRVKCSDAGDDWLRLKVKKLTFYNACLLDYCNGLEKESKDYHGKLADFWGVLRQKLLEQARFHRRHQSCNHSDCFGGVAELAYLCADAPSKFVPQGLSDWNAKRKLGKLDVESESSRLSSYYSSGSLAGSSSGYGTGSSSGRSGSNTSGSDSAEAPAPPTEKVRQWYDKTLKKFGVENEAVLDEILGLADDRGKAMQKGTIGKRVAKTLGASMIQERSPPFSALAATQAGDYVASLGLGAAAGPGFKPEAPKDGTELEQRVYQVGVEGYGGTTIDMAKFDFLRFDIEPLSVPLAGKTIGLCAQLVSDHFGVNIPARVHIEALAEELGDKKRSKIASLLRVGPGSSTVSLESRSFRRDPDFFSGRMSQYGRLESNHVKQVTYADKKLRHFAKKANKMAEELEKLIDTLEARDAGPPFESCTHAKKAVRTFMRLTKTWLKYELYLDFVHTFALGVYFSLRSQYKSDQKRRFPYKTAGSMDAWISYWVHNVKHKDLNEAADAWVDSALSGLSSDSTEPSPTPASSSSLVSASSSGSTAESSSSR